MEIFVEWIAVGVLAVLVALTALFARRTLVTRAGGTIKLNLRLSTMVHGRGWSAGFARFDGDDLRWYRLFSLACRPRRVLSRNGLVVQSTRDPSGPERRALPHDWVILRCTAYRSPVEIAMARSTVMGFLSWLEATPPGAHSRLATR